MWESRAREARRGKCQLNALGPGIMGKLGMVMKQKNAESEKILFNYDNGHRNVAMEIDSVSLRFPG